MIHLLQRAHLGQGTRTLPANQDHRHPTTLGISDRGDRISDSGTSGHCRDPNLTSSPSPALCSVRGSLLVTKINDPNPQIKTAVVDGLDVTTTERKEVTDPLVF